MYEWKLEYKHRIVRQGALSAKSKKEVEAYLLKSLTDDEKELLLKNKLVISLV